MYKVKHNSISINSMEAYIKAESSFNNDCKEVIFVRALGAGTDIVADIGNMDRTLAGGLISGKAFYKRVSTLPRLINNEDVIFYTDRYNTIMNGDISQLHIKADIDGDIVSQACHSAFNLYKNCEPNVTETMKKNFMIKCLFWFDSVFATKRYRFSPQLCSKIVVTNVTKVQEYLFWYMVSLCGNDVMMLQVADDLSLNHELDRLSEVFRQGEFKDVLIPDYDESAIERELQKANVIAAAAYSTPRSNIKVVIPPRAGRSTSTQQVTVSQPVQPQIVTPQIIPSQGGSVAMGARVEKSYEELAQMASSVVLIGIHGKDGKVIGSGSGIMIGRNGYILTNNHVASGGFYYSVKIEEDDHVYTTEQVIKYHSVLDLAIIRIDRQLNPLPIYKGPNKLVRGQRVVAIGSPLGLFNSVSDGIISGFRKIGDVDMIQFTAPISHGSSGGAVLNMYGEVIGISTAGIDEGQNINLAMGYECINTFVRGFIG